MHIVIIFFEVEYVLNVRSSESIDTLGIVSHHTDVSMSRCKIFDYQILCIIGVLILIDHYITKPLSIFVGCNQIAGQELVEVEQYGFFQPSVIFQIDFAYLGFACNTVVHLSHRVVDIFLRRDQGGLCRGNAVEYIRRIVNLGVEAHVFDYRANQCFAVGSVVDDEISEITQLFGFHSQYSGSHRVERTHKNAPCTLTYKPHNSVFHLFGSLVGKG